MERTELSDPERRFWDLMDRTYAQSRGSLFSFNGIFHDSLSNLAEEDLIDLYDVLDRAVCRLFKWEVWGAYRTIFRSREDVEMVTFCQWVI